MKEYLFLFRGGEPMDYQNSPEKWQGHMQRWMTWMGEMAKVGRLGSSQPLDRTGKQVSGGGKTVTDGPYLEGKELVGGYLILKAESYDDAVAFAKGCPIFEFKDGLVEVRAIQELKM
jgi:hypothetical protein